MRNLELYIHTPFCVKNVNIVIFCLFHLMIIPRRDMSMPCFRRLSIMEV